MRLCICGSRTWTDHNIVAWVMDGIICDAADHEETVTLVNGVARGADAIALDVATDYGLEIEKYPADWDGHGRAGGPIRNAQMIRTDLDLVVAFSNWPLTPGTADMVAKAKAACVPTYVVSCVR